jgi:catechol 2,3-dioxygenase-like lactoylglutathione lyase family enzyme
MSGARIVAVQLVCYDVAAPASFFSEAFGARAVAGREVSCRLTTLMLGEQCTELVATNSQSRVAAPSDSTAFQHCAIVVSDMPMAMKGLCTYSTWSPICPSGAEALPKSSGGVMAFKFRDPEGHPLEFLQFPNDSVPAYWKDSKQLFHGIDHSAITTADSEQAARFYVKLGLSVIKRQVNEGAEQQRLDDVAAPLVDVTTLETSEGGPPNIELLDYRIPGAVVEVGAMADIRSTRLIFDVSEFTVPQALFAASRAPVADPGSTDVTESWLRDHDGQILILRGHRS